MDRPLSPGDIWNDRIKTYLRYAFYILLVLAAVLLLRQFLTRSVTLNDIRTSVVTKGPILNTITATGTVIPASEQILTAPIEGVIRKIFLTPGTSVLPGSAILELDKEFVQLAYESMNDELEVRKIRVIKLNLEFEKNIKDLQLDDQIKGLHLESLKTQLQDAKNLESIGGATHEEVQKADLELQIAKLEKQKLENDLGFRKTSLKKRSKKSGIVNRSMVRVSD